MGRRSHPGPRCTCRSWTARSRRWTPCPSARRGISRRVPRPPIPTGCVYEFLVRQAQLALGALVARDARIRGHRVRRVRPGARRLAVERLHRRSLFPHLIRRARHQPGDRPGHASAAVREGLPVATRALAVLHVVACDVRTPVPPRLRPARRQARRRARDRRQRRLRRFVRLLVLVREIDRHVDGGARRGVRRLHRHRVGRLLLVVVGHPGCGPDLARGGDDGERRRVRALQGVGPACRRCRRRHRRHRVADVGARGAVLGHRARHARIGAVSEKTGAASAAEFVRTASE